MKYYTINEVAKKYGTSISAVYYWIDRGLVNATKRFDKESGRRRLMISEADFESSKAKGLCLSWSFERLSSDIDIVARNSLEVLYGIRDDIDSEIMKYEKILSIIRTEETF